MKQTAFALEPWCPALFGEILPLANAHWQELNPSSDTPLAINFLRYHDLESAGVLRCFTARHGDTLVGYSLFHVGTGIHCASTKMASHDSLFVEKASRGSLAIRFIKWCDAQLKEEGVRSITQHSRLDHPIDRLLLALGYHATETVYTKELGD